MGKSTFYNQSINTLCQIRFNTPALLVQRILYCQLWLNHSAIALADNVERSGERPGSLEAVRSGPQQEVRSGPQQEQERWSARTLMESLLPGCTTVEPQSLYAARDGGGALRVEEAADTLRRLEMVLPTFSSNL